MPDSNITKRALASSLKELMEDMPFSKITVADICGKCGMNRKSFYYHFKDKYDLVNWIFDTECVELLTEKEEQTSWGRIMDVCVYFYTNRGFYRKVLLLRGQNSFSDHFREILSPLLAEWLKEILTVLGREEFLEDPIALDFYITFFADAFLCSLERWLTSRECLPPERFVRLLHSCFKITGEALEEIDAGLF